MQKKITLPTCLTLIRIALVPVFLFQFYHQHYKVAVQIFVIAGLTDFLDGFIARRFNMKSHLGSKLDPLADKLLMTAALLALTYQKMIPWQLTVLVMGRDFFILLGVQILTMLKRRLYFQPTLTSKCATASQLTVLTMALMQVWLKHHDFFWEEPISRLIDMAFMPLLCLAGILTLVTCFQYGLLGYRFYRYGERLADHSTFFKR